MEEHEVLLKEMAEYIYDDSDETMDSDDVESESDINERKFKEEYSGIKAVISAVEWHLWLAVIWIIVNLLSYYFRFGIYSGFTNELLYKLFVPSEWDSHSIKVVIYVTVIPLIFIVFWHIYYDTWYIKGMIGIVIVSYIMTIFYPLTDSIGDGLSGLFTIGFSLFVMSVCSEFDKGLLKYFAYSEDDDEKEMSSYEKQVLRLSRYYDEDANKVEIFYEQVRVLLDKEVTLFEPERDWTSIENDWASLEKDYIEDSEEDELKFPSIDSDNITLPENSIDMLDYINTSVREDFYNEYHGNISDESSPKNGLKISNGIEVIMKNNIARMTRPDLLLTYTMIALYKRTPKYMDFSIRTARKYVALYIQSGLYDFDEFFMDLYTLLYKYGIKETMFEGFLEDTDE